MFEKGKTRALSSSTLVHRPATGGQGDGQESGDASSAIELSGQPLVRRPAMAGLNTTSRTRDLLDENIAIVDVLKSTSTKKLS